MCALQAESRLIILPRLSGGLSQPSTRERQARYCIIDCGSIEIASSGNENATIFPGGPDASYKIKKSRRKLD